MAAACFRHPAELILTNHDEAWTVTGGTPTSKNGSSFEMSLVWSAPCFATVFSGSSVRDQTANSSHHRHFLRFWCFRYGFLKLARVLVVLGVSAVLFRRRMRLFGDGVSIVCVWLNQIADRSVPQWSSFPFSSHVTVCNSETGL